MHDKEAAISNLIGMLKLTEADNEGVFNSASTIYKRILPLNHWVAWELLMFFKLGKEAIREFEEMRIKKKDTGMDAGLFGNHIHRVRLFSIDARTDTLNKTNLKRANIWAISILNILIWEESFCFMFPKAPSIRVLCLYVRYISAFLLDCSRKGSLI